MVTEEKSGCPASLSAPGLSPQPVGCQGQNRAKAPGLAAAVGRAGCLRQRCPRRALEPSRRGAGLPRRARPDSRREGGAGGRGRSEQGAVAATGGQPGSPWPSRSPGPLAPLESCPVDGLRVSGRGPSGPIYPDAARVESASTAWCPPGAGAQSRCGDVTGWQRALSSGLAGPREEGRDREAWAPSGERPGEGFGTPLCGRPCPSRLQQGVPELLPKEQAGHV